MSPLWAKPVSVLCPKCCQVLTLIAFVTTANVVMITPTVSLSLLAATKITSVPV